MWTRWHSYLKQLICSCLASYFSGKSTKVGSPPNFSKLISQVWGTLQPQYFVTLFLDPYWTCLWNYFIYYKKETKVGSQQFGYQIWFCTRLVNRTYELSGITNVTPFRKYGKHSTGPSTYGLWVHTYSKLFSCKSVLTVCSYKAQSNEIYTYRRVSRGWLLRVRRLLYLWIVEYNQYSGSVGAKWFAYT